MTFNEEAFEAFWSVYPRKVAKEAAKREFMKALKKASFETIMEGLIAQVPTNLKKDDQQFIPHARKWLYDGRWDDDIEQPKQRTGIIGAAMRGMGHARSNQSDYRGHVQLLQSVAKH